jgi:DNA-binding protein HU-beta
VSGKGHEVNKAELVTALAEQHLDGDRKAAAVALDGLLDVIVRTVQTGGTVSLTGFGVFERRERAARAGRNPRTGAVIQVPAANVPAFRPGTGFRDVVSGAREPGGAPAARPAARPATRTRAAAPAASVNGAAAPAAAKPAPKAAAPKAAAPKAAAAKTPAPKATATKAAPKTAAKAAPKAAAAPKPEAKAAAPKAEAKPEVKADAKAKDTAKGKAAKVSKEAAKNGKVTSGKAAGKKKAKK